MGLSLIPPLKFCARKCGCTDFSHECIQPLEHTILSVKLATQCPLQFDVTVYGGGQACLDEGSVHREASAPQREPGNGKETSRKSSTSSRRYTPVLCEQR